MKTWARKGSGFTIVELLIVIVVIAILAAISIVAYNGIQDRAKNNSTIQLAAQLQKLVFAYVNGSGQLPATGTFCFTKDNICTSDSGATPVDTNNGTLVTKLSEYGTVPNSAPYPTGIRTSYASGRMVNNVLNPFFIIYWLKGTNSNCGLQAVTGSGTSWVNSTTGYTSSSDGMTYCIVATRDPSTL